MGFRVRHRAARPSGHNRHMGRTERNGQDGSLRVAGRYRLVERLGTGGMSVVWRGYDEVLGRPVAVKVLSPRLANDQTFRDRLRQEALAAARLCHPHITGIFDFGEYPLTERLTVPYVVMELNDGESVAARIGRQGSLDWREAVTIAVEVASALATAHARGLVHRDVTPANVMLTGAGAKVVDFGISAIVGQRDAAPDGSLLGTPAYLAPERLGGSQVSAATDVYALGLLLYRSLTGRLPWPAENTAEALRAHLYAAPEPVPDMPGLPSVVGELCLRCLVKRPEDRPGAAEVARVLAATVGLQPVIPLLDAGEARPMPARGAAAPVAPAAPAASVRLPGSRGPSFAELSRAILAYLGLPGGIATARRGVTSYSRVTPETAPCVGTADHAATGSGPDRAGSVFPSGRAVSGVGSSRGSSGVGPGCAASRVGPDHVASGSASGRTASGVAPDRTASGVAPDRTASGVAPDRTASGVAPDRGSSGVAPDCAASRLGANRAASGTALDAADSAGSPDRTASRLAADHTASVFASEPTVRGAASDHAGPDIVAERLAPSGGLGPLPSAEILRLRVGLKIGSALGTGDARPLGAGVFAGGRFGRDLLTGRGLLRAVRGPRPAVGPWALDGPTLWRGRHRAQVVVVTVALLAVAGLSWSTTRSTPDVEQAQAAGAGSVAAVPVGTRCAVRYQLKRDSGSDYEAQLTVAATDDFAHAAWRVRFSYPGSQRLTGAAKAITQKGRKVVVKGRGKLQAFALRGNYRGVNPLPLSFTLDGHRCRAEILGSVTAGRDDGGPVSEAAGPEKKQSSRGQGGSAAQSGPSAPSTGSRTSRSSGAASVPDGSGAPGTSDASRGSGGPST
jgi:hypothetical protein